MGDNKQQLRALNFNKLWSLKAPKDAVVEKAERIDSWPEPPPRGDPYRTAPRCDGCDHVVRRLSAAVDELGRFKRRVILHLIAFAIGTSFGITILHAILFH